MDQIEFFKVVAGISSAAAVGAVASHVRVRERVARLEERVITLGEKVDATLGGIERLEANATAQSISTERMAIQVEAIMHTLQRRPMPGRD